eukprot:snap_masked-scaffold_1-processed-gene-30.46-mRNA-1 protein AED:1.00 eAED:1.00 QI:0/0/0/0/1/1/2/0/70
MYVLSALLVRAVVISCRRLRLILGAPIGAYLNLSNTHGYGLLTILFVLISVVLSLKRLNQTLGIYSGKGL